ncbi:MULTISPECIES: DUF2798 domain-containing protein [Shewanella]|uniref:DUF2798 domain-containing protein n=1 Tax=Shewanella TaxID=22 RepID=UPI001BBA624A|nr:MULTISPECIES: DUF2798 domain-containing protein [Shewanella]GIU54125.1 hypothetical protein TUM4249_37660 [Shewanella sp. KT0246]
MVHQALNPQSLNAQAINSPTFNSSEIVTLKPTNNKTPLIYKVLTVLGMMTLMGGTLTGVMTFLNLGYSDSFFSDWLSAFLLAAVTVMPAGFTMMALLTKLVEILMLNSGEKLKNTLIGISMALIMESGIALSTTYNNLGVTNSETFFTAWFNTLVTALPFALTIMVIVSLTIKPKVEAILKG